MVGGANTRLCLPMLRSFGHPDFSALAGLGASSKPKSCLSGAVAAAESIALLQQHVGCPGDRVASATPGRLMLLEQIAPESRAALAFWGEW